MNPSRLVTPIACALLAAAAASPLGLAQEARAPAKSEEETIQLDAFTVSEKAQTEYGVTTLSGATRLNTPIREIPQSVNVVTKNFIDIIGAVNLEDLANWLPGVAPRQNVMDGTVIRSFLTFRTYNDGIRNFNGNYQADFANIQRVEVIKGPAAAVIGTAEAGGFINRVSKTPLARPRYSTRFIVGSEDMYRTELDFNQPLTRDNKVLGRFVAAYQNSRSTIPLQPRTERTVLAPQVQWRPFPATTVLAQYEFQNVHTPNDFGYPYWQNPTLPFKLYGYEVRHVFPRDFYAGELFAGNDNEVHNAKITTTHRFSHFLQGRLVLAGFKGYVATQRATLGTQRGSEAAGTTIDRVFDKTRGTIGTFNLQADLVSLYKIRRTSHSSLVGFEYIRNDEDRLNYTGALPSINPLHPVYGALPTNVRLTGDALFGTWQKGIFFQQQSKLFDDRMVITAGVRYDRSKLTTENRFNKTFTRTTPVQEDWAKAPRIGASYALFPNLNVYGIYSSQESPAESRRQFPNDPADQTILVSRPTATLHEGGIKAELLQGRWSMQAAYFDLFQRGFFQATTRANGLQENVIIPGFAVTGMEIDNVITPTKKLKIVAGYTYNFEFLNEQTGDVTPAVPVYKVNLFFNYDLTPRWSVNGRMVALGREYSRIWFTRAQQVYGGGLGYRFKNGWRANFTMNNITNTLFLTALITPSSNGRFPFRSWQLQFERVW